MNRPLWLILPILCTVMFSSWLLCISGGTTWLIAVIFTVIAVACIVEERGHRLNNWPENSAAYAMMAVLLLAGAVAALFAGYQLRHDLVSLASAIAIGLLAVIYAMKRNLDDEPGTLILTGAALAEFATVVATLT